MHKHFVRHQLFGYSTIKIFALVAIFTLSVIGVTQQVGATQSMSEYCSQYTEDDNNACMDGVKGTPCKVYLDVFAFDQAKATRTNLICKQAASDRSAGIVSTSTTPTSSQSPTPTNITSPPSNPSPSTQPTTPTPTPTPDPSQDVEALKAQVQSLADQAKGIQDQLSQYLDELHQSGEDADVNVDEYVSNNYDSYTNGAGKQQELKIMQRGNGSSPVILFINGGGWHMNDNTSYRVMNAEQDKDVPGENPWNRGYAMIEITYRLGSSGVNYMYEDVMRGIYHVISNASMYGIDPNKVVIWGDSAGGSLSMRAAASGKSGAKAAVGWSAITNAYTALFRSIAALAIGIDHSTCAPTDIAGLANFADLAAGGNGDVAEYGGGLSNNDFSSLGISGSGGITGSGFNPLALLSEGLVAGKNLLSAAKNFETVTNQIQNKDFSSLFSSTVNLASKKFVECIDNFNALSPALFTSPDTPPSFLAEFENDMTVGPDQATGMRDKLQQLGIQSEALILPGTEDCVREAADTFGTGCHLGYYSPFVKQTLDFLDSVIGNDWQPVLSNPGGGGSGGGLLSGKSSNNSLKDQKNAQCATIGSVFVSDRNNPSGGACQSITCQLELLNAFCSPSFLSKQ